MKVLTKEATERLPVGTEISKTLRFLVTALQKRLRVLFLATANTTKLGVTPPNYPSFSLFLAPVSSVFELTTTPLLACASRIDVTLAAILEILISFCRPHIIHAQ